MTFDIIIRLYGYKPETQMNFEMWTNDIKTTQKRHGNDMLLSCTLDSLNPSEPQAFLVVTWHLSLKFSREFETLVPLKSDFTLTKPLNSLENLKRPFILSFPLSPSIIHFSAFKLHRTCRLYVAVIPKICRFYVISMSFLCRFYVINADF